jgi:hypothetical protein
MQKEHSPKPSENASCDYPLALASSLIDRLDVVGEVIGALDMMTSKIEDDCYRLPFRRIIELAETELAFVRSLFEDGSSQLRIVAEELRAGERKSAKPTAANRAAASADPLSSAIADYVRGEDAFNAINSDDHAAMGGEDAVVAQTYGPPMAVLEDWQKPAMTRASALEALRLADAENSAFDCSAISKAMVTAALAFFEKEAG